MRSLNRTSLLLNWKCLLGRFGRRRRLSLQLWHSEAERSLRLRLSHEIVVFLPSQLFDHSSPACPFRSLPAADAPTEVHEVVASSASVNEAQRKDARKHPNCQK